MFEDIDEPQRVIMQNDTINTSTEISSDLFY
jgi:hypothetical protein